MLLLLLCLAVAGAKVIDFIDTPRDCRSLTCPDGSSCMEMPEGAFCWPVFIKQTQVQPSIDEPPALMVAERPPKPSCSSIQCAADEQCVNAFDGPTCRRVTFDLSTKWITTTTASPWFPEAPQTVSVFVERETSRPAFRKITPSPPAPPSAWKHHEESKAAENGDMPPTSFRKPSVPNSCDRVRCPAGQTCFMREVKCLTEMCFPVPYCQ